MSLDALFATVELSDFSEGAKRLKSDVDAIAERDPSAESKYMETNENAHVVLCKRPSRSAVTASAYGREALYLIYIGWVL